MDISIFLKSVIDSDSAPIVICDLSHTIVYMNPSAAERYKKRGGYELVGRSLMDCHNADSRGKIERCLGWFGKSAENNKVYEFRNEKENKDVYMIALRDDNGSLIGYYEKHECRTHETAGFYNLE